MPSDDLDAALERATNAILAARYLGALTGAGLSVESGIPLHDRVATTVTLIDIAAPPDRVWPLVASVDTIRASERRPALFTRIGFPAPIAATLDHEGVGGVRTASFERGVVFHEAVTTWEPGRRLSFTIDATQVPPGALDDHVAVGGPFFDVLTGTYELIPAGDHHTRLRLTSAHRVGTHLNWYASGWVHVVMRSIQGNILQVLKTRAERPAAAQGGPGLRRAPVPGGELEYVDRGQGEPIVFVHGVLMADLLLPLATEPAFAGDRAIVVHRRGYAGSTPAGASWSVAQDAGDLAALLRHLGIPRAHVVAHSAGGIVAMEFAASYPQMTTTLTLLDPPLNFMQAQRLQPRPGGADETERFLLEKGGSDLRAQLEARLPGALPQVRRDVARFNAIEWVALGAWSFDAARARQVTAPVLFLSQKRDPMVDTLQRWWPTMQFVEVPRATHMFPFERSAPTAATIAEFVSHHRNQD